MAHAGSGYTAGFTVWSHRCIQTRQVSQDMDSFMFSILMKQQQNGLKTNHTEGA
jgi:hypothetical protein